MREVLSNEKYIGNNVYNRRSFKLKKVRVVNQPEMWIKKEGAFEGIVPPDLFYTAQGIPARGHIATPMRNWSRSCADCSSNTATSPA